MAFIGRNVNRDIGAPGIGQRTIGEDLERARTKGQPPILQRAVVIDVIMNPNIISDERLEVIRNTVNNPQFVDVMPVNSVIARVTSEGQGCIANMNTIVFPLFSSHFMLPIQPGEMIEVIYEDYFGSGNGLGYWISRICSERTIEDANYTHYDRRFDPSMNPKNYTTSERRDRDTDQPVPGFPNGGNSSTTVTLTENAGNRQPYERIVTNATAYQHGTRSVVTPEAVPRWQKRPQELVFQGANNTLICLGEDRKGGLNGAIEGDSRDAKRQAGTIDMIVGRGRHLPGDPTALPDAQKGDSSRSPTAPIITKNTRDNVETNKAPYRKMPGERRLGDNPNEGNPDFEQDAARLYLTMQSEADINFGIASNDYTTNTLPEGENKNKILQPNEGVEGTTNKSYMIGKADHVRFIARKDADRSIEGTILLLREGESEIDLNYIFMDKNGVHIEGPKIILGRGLADIANPNSSPMPGGEPYIRWSKFRDTVARLQEEMDAMRARLEEQIDAVTTQLQNTRASMSLAFLTSLCIPYSPDSALIQAAAKLQPAAIGGSDAMSPAAGGAYPEVSMARTSLNSDLNTARDSTAGDVEASKSEKIFGE